MDTGRRCRFGICRLPAAVVTRFLSIALLALAMTGCAVHRTLAPDSYVVQRGDSLSAIGADYGIDWHKLAQWNHIQPPYQLEVGQRLWLTPYPPIDYAKLSSQQSKPAPASSAPERAEPRASDKVSEKPPTLHRTIESSPQWSQDNAGSASQTGAPQTTQTASTASDDQSDEEPAQPASDTQASQGDDTRIDETSRSAATQQADIQAGGPSEDGWQWPATGSLLRQYDPSSSRQGVEIGGKVGAPVYAASSGTVVYNGSGLQGYGKLIIIKHDAHYLSAYGFNKRSLVKQGQTVAAGAHIAAMGLGPGNKPMLHFEVRHDGEPMDPEKVLPEQ